MNLPPVNDSNKGKYMWIGYVIFCLLYCSAGQIHLFPAEQLSISAMDVMIPFIPETIWIYNSQFLFLFLALWLCPETLRRTITYYAMLLATALAFLFFIFMPTVLPHHDVNVGGLTGLLWQTLYLTDTPQNCFPSLHVALALLAAQAVATKNKYWRIAAPLWAMFICLSTLTTKQHYIIDILGGMVVAIIAWSSVNYAFIAEYAHENSHE
jgi:membrane-associated phospholipid phosphatase